MDFLASNKSGFENFKRKEEKSGVNKNIIQSVRGIKSIGLRSKILFGLTSTGRTKVEIFY